MSKSIEKACYWMTTAPFTYEPQLEGKRRTEIAIIGGGFTGLWTAVFIRQLAPEAEIVVLEQGMAGFGASGRNAGILDVTLDHSHSLAISHFGFSEAKKMANIGIQNVQELVDFLNANNIA